MYLKNDTLASLLSLKSVRKIREQIVSSIVLWTPPKQQVSYWQYTTQSKIMGDFLDTKAELKTLTLNPIAPLIKNWDRDRDREARGWRWGREVIPVWNSGIGSSFGNSGIGMNSWAFPATPELEAVPEIPELEEIPGNSEQFRLHSISEIPYRNYLPFSEINLQRQQYAWGWGWEVIPVRNSGIGSSSRNSGIRRNSCEFRVIPEWEAIPEFEAIPRIPSNSVLI